MRHYFWMVLAYWLNLRVIIKCDGKKEIGYLATPKNQSGRFYLWSKYPGEMLMMGETKKVEYVSFFWGFLFHKPAVVLKPTVESELEKENHLRLISPLPISGCIPIDGNIPHLEIPPVKILNIPNSWENKSKRNYQKR